MKTKAEVNKMNHCFKCNMRNRDFCERYFKFLAKIKVCEDWD